MLPECTITDNAACAASVQSSMGTLATAHRAGAVAATSARRAYASPAQGIDTYVY